MEFFETLREAREALGITQKQVADDLQISSRVITAFESGDFSRLPARIYSRGFFKKYLARLGVDREPMLSAFDKAWEDFFPEIQKEHSSPLVDRQKYRFSITRKGLALFISSFFIILILWYFLYQFRYVIRPPTLSIASPKEDTVVGDDIFPITGSVEKEANLTVNGRQIYTNERGEFNDSVLLSAGLNRIEFIATNRFGKTNTVIRYILVK